MKAWNLMGLMIALVFAGALPAPAAQTTKLDRDVMDAVQLFQKSDTKMQKLFDEAYGYAVFPSIGKGAAGIGGAAGDGEVFERGYLIGQARMTQVTVGAQLGGQQYAEVVFFENRDALDAFKESKMTMSAEASAVAAAEGASAIAKYRLGVLVFTIAKTGLMFEASVGGQKFTYKTPETIVIEDKRIDEQTADAIVLFKQSDSKMQKLFDEAYGYAVFPSIGKGAIGIGGAAGDGLVYEKDRMVGKTRMTQITIGAQLGGQQYAEIVFFENREAMDAFKESKMTMAAEVSAVAAAEGASANAKYRLGVLVFTIAKKGLMFEASLGGQKFDFKPIEMKPPRG